MRKIMNRQINKRKKDWNGKVYSFDLLSFYDEIMPFVCFL